MALATLSGGRHLMQSLCKNATVVYQQQRNIVNLRHRFPPLVPSFGKKPHRAKRKHKVYVWEGDSMLEEQEKLTLILTEDVSRIGMKGDVVTVRKSVGRNMLLAKNRAVYASQENIREFVQERAKREEQSSEKILTGTALKTIAFLQKHKLVVKMRSVPHWDTLSKEIVIHAFNKHLGVVVPDHALELPEEPITDYGTYTVKVTINQLETVEVEMDVQHYINKGKQRREAQKMNAAGES
ncbi:39S ribosomal protein L9, mitochondrial-like [Asterias rubens]|uniref:39S ribosomal protein L9, mitochondrial-like n=1 Tax=Asterias rubens TaxID=7604 RepID=UPI0014554238|nr:39S ribosomal protein L9, mitochondrial-like [Asterias rubens]